MQKKIFITLAGFGLYQAAINTVRKISEGSQKYLSLEQFDNTESSFQVFQASLNITYINYFLIASLIFCLWAIWKPKKAVEQK